MQRLQRVLVPVDFSPISRVVLDHAAALGRAFGASVDLLHVWEIPMIEATGPLIAEARVTLTEATRKNAEAALGEFAAQAKKRGVDSGRLLVIAGSPAFTIVNVATAGDYDLIVIGSHDRTNWCRRVLGSVAERVVRHASCPVLCVPEDRQGAVHASGIGLERHAARG